MAVQLLKTPSLASGTDAGNASAGKTGGTGKTAQGPSAQGAAQPKTARPPAAEAPSKPALTPSAPPAASRPVSAILAAMQPALPSALTLDKLYASIISFARFFSLPLKPELIAEIRRQALSQAALCQDDPDTDAAPEAAAKYREALALAAAAAESKGAGLGQKALEAFASAIDPGRQKRRGGGDRQGESDREREKREEREKEPREAAGVSASGLQKMALEAMEKDPLLDLLNRLPCKNGRRWIVFPFSFSQGGREFRVSLRIMLDAGNAARRGGNAAGRSPGSMVLDIAESGENGRKWLFALEEPAGRLSVFVYPELPPGALAALERSLAGETGIPSGQISVKNRTEPFPVEAGSQTELLRSVNEAV
ncbi:MAG: hypothetical protein FWH38_05720 [Treponema sp.]|nr:hypothetical protein [Treponema sp.]